MDDVKRLVIRLLDGSSTYYESGMLEEFYIEDGLIVVKTIDRVARYPLVNVYEFIVELTEFDFPGVDPNA